MLHIGDSKNGKTAEFSGKKRTERFKPANLNRSTKIWNKTLKAEKTQYTKRKFSPGLRHQALGFPKMGASPFGEMTETL